MAEIENTSILGREKTRSEDRVRALTDEWQHQLLELVRVVFEIGIVDHADIALRSLDTRADRGSLASILRVLEQPSIPWPTA